MLILFFGWSILILLNYHFWMNLITLKLIHPPTLFINITWFVEVTSLISSTILRLFINPSIPTNHTKLLGYANTFPQIVSGLEAKFGSKIIKYNLRYWLSEEICYLFCSGDVLSDEKSMCNLFMNKMVIQLDMITKSMKHHIYCHMKSTYVIAIEN